MSIKICVDYGHGKNSGARSGNMIEDELINVTGEECVRVLKEAGFTVKTTRGINEFTSINNRCVISNNFGSNFFISIHYNCDSGKGEGFECIRSVRENIVSVSIANNIIKRLPTVNQIKRPNAIYTKIGNGNKDYFGVLRGTKCPAIIVEGGFIDNTNDRNRLNSNDKLKKFGKMYAEAIIEYFGKQSSVPSTNPTPPPVEEFKMNIPSSNNINQIKGIVKVSLGDKLNVRQMPDANSKIITTLNNEDGVNLVFLTNNWWAISLNRELYNNSIAFVNKNYIHVL